MRALWPALALVLAGLPTALGHAHVDVGDGKYELTIGWVDEPPYAGFPNGLDLKVAVKHVEGDEHAGPEDEHAHEQAEEETEHAPEDDHVVLGAHENLTVTYEFGGRTFEPLDLRPAFGRPGWYTADITPTRPGVYKIHVRGAIEGTPVNVTVEPHEIEALDQVSFPEADPTAADLAERVDALEARLARLEAETDAQIRDPPPPQDRPTNDVPASGVLAGAGAALMVALALSRR